MPERYTYLFKAGTFIENEQENTAIEISIYMVTAMRMAMPESAGNRQRNAYAP